MSDQIVVVPPADPGPWFVLADPVCKDLHPMHRARYVATSTDVEISYENGEPHGWRFVNDTDVIICTMPDSPAQEAHARLLAAAPKMRSALAEMLEAFTAGDSTQHSVRLRAIETLAEVERGMQ